MHPVGCITSGRPVLCHNVTATHHHQPSSNTPKCMHELLPVRPLLARQVSASLTPASLATGRSHCRTPNTFPAFKHRYVPRINNTMHPRAKLYPKHHPIPTPAATAVLECRLQHAAHSSCCHWHLGTAVLHASQGSPCGPPYSLGPAAAVPAALSCIDLLWTPTCRLSGPCRVTKHSRSSSSPCHGCADQTTCPYSTGSFSHGNIFA